MAGIDKFKKVWKNLDEDTKEIIANALYILSQPSHHEVVKAYYLAKLPLTEKRTELLKKIARITQNT